MRFPKDRSAVLHARHAPGPYHAQPHCKPVRKAGLHRCRVHRGSGVAPIGIERACNGADEQAPRRLHVQRIVGADEEAIGFERSQTPPRIGKHIVEVHAKACGYSVLVKMKAAHQLHDDVAAELVVGREAHAPKHGRDVALGNALVVGGQRLQVLGVGGVRISP